MDISLTECHGHITSTSTYFLAHIERERNRLRSEAFEARDDGQPEVRRGRPRTRARESRIPRARYRQMSLRICKIAIKNDESMQSFLSSRRFNYAYQ